MDKNSYFHAQNILWSFVLTHNSTCSHHVLTAGSLQSMFIYTLCTIFNLSLSFISLFSFSSTCSSFSITSYHSHDLIAFSRGTFFIFWHQNGLCNAFSISLPPLLVRAPTAAKQNTEYNKITSRIFSQRENVPFPSTEIPSDFHWRQENKIKYLHTFQHIYNM